MHPFDSKATVDVGEKALRLLDTLCAHGGVGARSHEREDPLCPGLSKSLGGIMGFDLDVPDQTTLSRRSGILEVLLIMPPSDGPIEPVVDNTGLAIFGQGQWAAAERGGKRIQGCSPVCRATAAQGGQPQAPQGKPDGSASSLTLRSAFG